jgi:imidazolonepropionase-like amidohydrolase
MRQLTLIVSLFCFLFLQTTIAQNTKTYEYKNGIWYVNEQMMPGTWYIQNGLLTQKVPAKIDSVIDLQNRWVVPPMGDAHCSSVTDLHSPKENINLYMAEGVFYLQVLSNSIDGREKSDKLLNKSNTPDVIYANGGITCTLGFPFVKYEAPAWGLFGDNLKARYEQLLLNRKMAGNGYWFIDTKEDLNQKWTAFLAQKPSIVSIYLLDAKNNGGKEGKGLTPAMAKAVVKMAHKSNLRVYAHVETIEDLRLGLKLGVDGIANLPGNDWNGLGDSTRYIITTADAKKLVKKKTVIIPTIGHLQQMGNPPATRKLMHNSLKILNDSKANIVLGSDDSQRTTFSEINQIRQLGAVSSTQLLKIFCQNTPAAIFPNRKIGKIAEGYEGSFLVLLDDPMTNILKIRATSFMVKNGVVLK